MKAWLRLLLVTMNVGGGFTGIAVGVQGLFSSPNHRIAHLAELFLFTFVTLSGLVFVHDPRRSGPLLVAVALQIPWVSSPLIVYQLISGFAVNVAVIAGSFRWSVTWLGSEADLTSLHGAPWGVGVNLLALVVFVLLYRLRIAPGPAAASSVMGSWQRLALVTVTVGGGFGGMVVTTQAFVSDRSQWLGCCVGFALYTFITVSGLILAYDPRRIGALFVALTLQVPWLSSPLVVYQCVSGFAFSVAIIGGSFKWTVDWVGSQFDFDLLGQAPWGAGVNLFAIVMLALLWWSAKKAHVASQPGDAPADAQPVRGLPSP